MFHIFTGTIEKIGNDIYISNDHLGIQIHYSGLELSSNKEEAISYRSEAKIPRTKGVGISLFIYPHIDDNNKTIKYFAFDTHTQKTVFEKLLKISGIGPKTAFHIAQIPESDIEKAIKDLDVKFFQNIPGIGPKSAKKILLELKDTIKTDDLQKLAIDEKLLKKITSTLKGLGYESKKVHSLLSKYPDSITENNLSEVVKWLMKGL